MLSVRKLLGMMCCRMLFSRTYSVAEAFGCLCSRLQMMGCC